MTAQVRSHHHTPRQVMVPAGQCKIWACDVTPSYDSHGYCPDHERDYLADPGRRLTQEQAILGRALAGIMVSLDVPDFIDFEYDLALESAPASDAGVLEIKRPEDKSCFYWFCPRGARTRGLCERHYSELKRDPGFVLVYRWPSLRNSAENELAPSS